MLFIETVRLTKNKDGYMLTNYRNDNLFSNIKTGSKIIIIAKTFSTAAVPIFSKSNIY